MDLLTKKIKHFKELGATDDYINEVLSLVEHEKRTAGVNFKNMALANIENSKEVKTFQVMDVSSIDKILEETKREWLNK